ncbi:MAG TPA: hypothetical protein VEF03_10130 [Candidatus Binataceae bacterium]|nr:hypothetical protein [Candidatus Binataceae bacterium]
MGADESGFCAAACLHCQWRELGVQIRRYEEIITALASRRHRIEKRIGTGVRSCGAKKMQKPAVQGIAINVLGELIIAPDEQSDEEEGKRRNSGVATHTRHALSS